MTESNPTSDARVLKAPPLLLGAALLFWGWQSDLPAVGAVMGIILESARVFKVRWDLSDTDFRRILAFCILLALATTLYIFTDAQETGGGFHGPAGVVGRAFGISSIKTSTTFFRWLPIFLFLFVAAQTFGTREKIPLFTISRWLAWQRRNKNAPVGNVNLSYPYFILCLFSASVHTNKGESSFFWGQCILISWALWRFRSRRSGILIWALALAVATILGNLGQHGIGFLQQKIENYDAQWFARFMRQTTDPAETITTMGQIGELKLSGKIVIRLHTKNGEPPPTYLREASYRAYYPAKKSWYAGPKNESDFDNNPVLPQHDQTTWVLLSKTNTSSVNIACYLDGRSIKTGNPEGLLPLPAGSGRLENLYAYALQRNDEGAVLAEGPGLVIFDALYGPGATIDAPPGIDSSTNLDYLVPTNEIPALKSVIAEMKISGANEGQKLLAVQNFFASKFTYSLWQGPDKLATTNETTLTRFLLHSRSGHCEYFATATVLLLRELGIPARYAVGYYVHEQSGHGYVVRERDAHAWCLVWHNGTWENLDTTPGSWVGIEDQRASAMQWLSDFWSWVGFEIAKLRWGQTNLREYIFWALIPVLALLLFQIIFKRGRKQRPQLKTGKSGAAIFWPGLDSEFYLLESRLAARGVPREPGEPLSIWLSRAAADPTLAETKNSLEELLRLHYRHRFDPHGLNETDRETLRRDAKSCLARLAETNRLK